MTANDGVLLFSGGVDSTVLLASEVNHQPRRNPLCLWFDYGQKHAGREWWSAYQLAHYYHSALKCATLPTDLFVGSALTRTGEVPRAHYNDPIQRATVVPGRNMTMLSLAASLASSMGIGCVKFAAHSGDAAIYPDCRPMFVSAASEALRLGCGVTVEAPFLSMTKADIVRLGRKLMVPLDMAWSCYVGGEKPCGECGACRERAEAETE